MHQRAAFFQAVLWAAAVGVVLAPVQSEASDATTPIDPIYVQYNGGSVIPSARVQTVFWGPWWGQNDQGQSALRDYFNQFFRDLFTDGRYMADLEQYSTARQHIGNGRFEQIDTVVQGPGSAAATMVTDVQIQMMLLGEISARNLPPPDSNTLYYVFLPPNVDVVEHAGKDTFAYHSFFPPGTGVQFRVVYAVIKYLPDARPEIEPNDPHLVTSSVSHELAEAVTDPLNAGWRAPTGEEIGDIPYLMYYVYGWLSLYEFWDVLAPPGGQRYLVQRVWSNLDNAPVAFR